MIDGCVMMLRDVSVGWGRAKGVAIVGYVVWEMEILEQDGVMGWTERERAWYHASTDTTGINS